MCSGCSVDVRAVDADMCGVIRVLPHSSPLHLVFVVYFTFLQRHKTRLKDNVSTLSISQLRSKMFQLCVCGKIVPKLRSIVYPEKTWPRKSPILPSEPGIQCQHGALCPWGVITVCCILVMQALAVSHTSRQVPIVPFHRVIFS